MIKVALIAMGCEKNVINSEQMLCLLDRAGMQLVDDPADADVTVINTCGFIENARQEALEQIEEALQAGSKVIVAGCMAERTKCISDEPQLTGVSGLVGTGRFDDIVSAVNAVMEGQSPLYYGGLDAPVSETPRIHTGAPHTAYLKIADGCDNRCSYCVIPFLRGAYRSRPEDAVLAEAEQLCSSGVRELIIIAQDVTRYGTDLDGSTSLNGLLKRLCGVPGLRRLRLHYLYPELITDELLETIASQPQIARYLDIPIQHASNGILKAMNRRYTQEELLPLIEKLRDRIPGVVIRTSIITGFPGESQEDFNELADFLRKTRIERVGVFAYSREEGTPAALLPEQVPEKTKRFRKNYIERLQSRVTDSFNAQRRGTVTEVLCEGYDRAAGIYYGRSEAESPDVDGKVFFSSADYIEPGEFVPVLITGSVEGDAVGRADIPANK